MIISGLSRSAVELILVKVPTLRNSRSTACAVDLSALALSLAKIKANPPPGPPVLILKRAPGTVCKACLAPRSISACGGRCPRSARLNNTEPLRTPLVDCEPPTAAKI